MEKKKWFFGIATASNIFKALIATVGATLFCGWLLFGVLGNEPGTLLPRIILIVFWVVFVPLFWIVTFGWHKLLRQNKSKSKQYAELHSDLDTTYMQPLDRAITASDEEVIAWYGPMGRNDMGGNGTQVGLKENISGENTLLITNYQIICLMVGPADTKNINTVGVASAVSNVTETVPTGDGVYNRKQQFEVLWFNQWDKIVANFLVPGQLAHILETHRNYGIPYNSILEVNIKQRFFNPGVHITLSNGKTLKYAGFDKRQLENVKLALEGKTTVKSSLLI